MYNSTHPSYEGEKLRRKVLAIVMSLLLAVTACATSPPDPKTPVDKTMTWETNGLEVAVTFHCTVYLPSRFATRTDITVNITRLESTTSVAVGFVITANGNDQDRRQPTRVEYRPDGAWIHKEAEEGDGFYTIFAYNGDTLIASALFYTGEPCHQWDKSP